MTEKKLNIASSESVYIQTNNDALITGETLYYQLYYTHNVFLF